MINSLGKLKIRVMKTMQQWLDEYGESHKNATNKLIHFICVPTIFFTVVGLLHGIKLPFTLPIAGGIELSVSMLLLVLVFVYYVVLSVPISVGMFFYSITCVALSEYIERLNFMPLWLFCTIVFVLAWILQFYGHNIEGKKPSFLKDLQFLMIGPAWIMSFILAKIGIKY
jgi:uncharacterized membrane protein YGL010W